jgi:hypothetical protein
VRSFEFAAAAPDGGNALVQKDGRLYIVRRLNGFSPVWRELNGAAASIGRAAWGAGSESLALLSSGEPKLEFWSKLSSEPKLSGTSDLTSLMEPVVSLAVDSAARTAFVATQGENGGTLFLLRPGEEPRVILPLGRAGALFLSSDWLYITDRGRNEVLRISGWDKSLRIETVASAAHGLSEPVGAALSADGKYVYVASAGTRQVLAVEIGTGAVKAALDLDFRPTRMERLGSGPLFLLAKGIPGEEPAQVLDANTRRVYFVPVSAAGGE